MLTCPYCGKPAQLTTGDYIYPHRHDLADRYFWTCWPCEAYVGCHKAGARVGMQISDGTLPLGRLADSRLRAAKLQAHAAFDPLWRSRQVTRRQAYHWLAEQLGIPVKECHIGEFDVQQCKRVVDVCFHKAVQSAYNLSKGESNETYC